MIQSSYVRGNAAIETGTVAGQQPLNSQTQTSIDATYAQGMQRDHPWAREPAGTGACLKNGEESEGIGAIDLATGGFFAHALRPVERRSTIVK
jgi:hypothetical protein